VSVPAGSPHLAVLWHAKRKRRHGFHHNRHPSKTKLNTQRTPIQNTKATRQPQQPPLLSFISTLPFRPHLYVLEALLGEVV
jgi:hypothetical protein